MAEGLNCPTCGSIDIGVSQTFQIESAVKRRRKCFDCKGTFYTYEIKADMIPTDPSFDFLFRKAPAQ